MQAKMPRQFWGIMAKDIEFNPVTRNVEAEIGYDATPAKGKAKKSLGQEIKQEVLLHPVQQTAAWTNLVSLVHHWNPSGQTSPQSGTSIVFFSPNLKHAQLCAMTLLHYMISKTFMLGERPYRAEVIRAHEIWHRITQGTDDQSPLPHVMLLPNIMPELTPNQSSMIAEILCSGYRFIAATNQTPQQFYDTYGVIPSHPFAVQAVRETMPTVDFVRVVQGAK
jgi:hypothetical protein